MERGESERGRIGKFDLVYRSGFLFIKVEKQNDKINVDFDLRLGDKIRRY